MNATHRIVLNTTTTYVRSLLSVGLALFSSRWVLNALGHTDFGLYNVVGSVLFLVTFFSTTLAASSTRYFAYSIGKRDAKETNRWFNSALILHVFLAFVLISAGWPIGEYFIQHILTIPPDRIVASIYVFRISLLSAFIIMIAIPMVAMFTAKQKLYELAAISTISSILNFIFAYILISGVEGDRLIFYAKYMTAIIILIQSLYIIRALKTIPECKLKFKHMFDILRWWEIVKFTAWHATNGIGYAASNQGIAIVLNRYFGPKANAAYGIANQVSTQTNQLSGAMVGALSPEITSLEGGGDRPRMLLLSNRSSKFSTLLTLLFFVPFMIDMNYILNLWLKNPPEYSAQFCRIILLAFLADKITIGHEIAVNAVGKIGVLFGVTGLLRIATLPLGYLFVVCGGDAVQCVTAILITNILITLFRIYWSSKIIEISFREWFADVAIKCFTAMMVATAFALIPYYFLQPSISRFVLILIMSTVGLFLIGWKYSLTPRELDYIYTNTRKIVTKFKGIINA